MAMAAMMVTTSRSYSRKSRVGESVSSSDERDFGFGCAWDGRDCSVASPVLGISRGFFLMEDELKVGS